MKDMVNDVCDGLLHRRFAMVSGVNVLWETAPCNCDPSTNKKNLVKDFYREYVYFQIMHIQGLEADYRFFDDLYGKDINDIERSERDLEILKHLKDKIAYERKELIRLEKALQSA